MTPISVVVVGIDFNVTDTFHIRVDAEGEPAEIWTTSNDPEEMWGAFDWVFANKLALFEAECIVRPLPGIAARTDATRHDPPKLLNGGDGRQRASRRSHVRTTVGPWRMDGEGAAI